MKYNRVETQDAIIIRRKNFRESDRMVTVFTNKTGRIRLVAKGVRKIKSKRSGHIEPFRLVRISIAKGKTFDVLTEILTLNGHEGIRSNLHKAAVAYYYCELIDLLTAESEPHENIFEFLDQSLTGLETANDDIQIRLDAYNFSVKLLRSLGFLAPETIIKPTELIPFIENIVERKLKTSVILGKIR